MAVSLETLERLGAISGHGSIDRLSSLIKLPLDTLAVLSEGKSKFSPAAYLKEFLANPFPKRHRSRRRRRF